MFLTPERSIASVSAAADETLYDFRSFRSRLTVPDPPFKFACSRDRHTSKFINGSNMLIGFEHAGPSQLRIVPG